MSTFAPHVVPGARRPAAAHLSTPTDVADPETQTPGPGYPAGGFGGQSRWMRTRRASRPVQAPPPRRMAWAPGALVVPFVALAISALVVLPPLLVTPGTVYQLGPVNVRSSNVAAWAQWNYSGVERKGGWAEMHDGIVPAMDKVTAKYGCGRAMWEYNANLNRFGTPMAPMLLPNYTDGCVDSMEGLLFESADHDAVPLHQPGRALGVAVRGHGARRPRASSTGRSTSRSGSSTCSCWA